MQNMNTYYSNIQIILNTYTKYCLGKKVLKLQKLYLKEKEIFQNENNKIAKMKTKTENIKTEAKLDLNLKHKNRNINNTIVSHKSQENRNWKC